MLEFSGSGTAARPHDCLALDWDLSGKKGDKGGLEIAPGRALQENPPSVCVCVYVGEGKECESFPTN